ncbi:MAG TPA: ribosome-associated translation inhibitor RaiA [Gammaproteobacteria bacterium]|nr:ribosome-associated translation inhibitor RaiA [Gammaproteobacteria bacterium]
MQLPLQITFRNMDASPAVESVIREKADKLERYYDSIMSCRVVVEASHRHHHKGNIYHVRVDLTVPNDELVVSREPHQDHSHEDLYVAIRDAFNAARRQLEEFARKQRGDVKAHVGPPEGEVILLSPEEDYGRIRTAEGREIYFHRNSVLGDGFDGLAVGARVRFTEETGEQGPQASTVVAE